ncbi:UDP-forming cellulose synthase catalytic subunit [Pseudomonas brassicacearum]|uniref:Cellulose synthase catalytic subunit [UDP-forming] n=1 Tax=Pseudomonas brassicacearum TaxID=930166 RepID=A0A423H6H3_9PSED|nr:UDP-forming cellulose synthase catalytic subunit [Pseudomonas brassicacearum]RON08801.1 UDP-forming cellulose synthase catalytic subunit [Pseudomonas brassicacearum]
MIARVFPYAHLRRRYDCSPPVALLLATMSALAWLLFRLESPSWRAVLDQPKRWYPQLINKAPSLGDPLRYAVQSLWLLLVRPARPQEWRFVTPAWLKAVGALYQRLWTRIGKALEELPVRAEASQQIRQSSHWWKGLDRRNQRLVNLAVGVVVFIFTLLCITEPFGYVAQLVFVLLLWGLAMLVRRVPGRFPTLLMVVLSTIVSCRYLWWRYTSTLNWNQPLDLACGMILLVAETYSWVVLILGYIQTCWPLGRKPAPLPRDTRLWPSVDLLIPTYNEDLSIVRGTVYAAMGIDWPADKLNIYILDDGRRESFRQFAAEVGVGYITRNDNRHAKAGNLNHALKQLNSELVAIFDCDHIPVRSFLQMTTGGFLRDPKLALVQTPHHFLSPDPFERNLNVFREHPNEGELFYGLIQDGNDMWNAAFFCGSCAVLRRTALDAIGGFAVETVTEDAHTALRLHRNGWNSAYIKVPQAAGLATESLSAHIGQRIRWARGMAQIFRTDNPLLGKGLTFFQRICYANAMMHFLAGLPRLVFLLAPLAFLLLHAYIIYAPALMILLYVLPHMIHASLTNSRMQGAYRRTFWGEVYETVLAWYIARPTTVALFNPRKGKFNVTAKGGLMENNQFDWKIAQPYLLLSLLNIAGLGFAIWRLICGPNDEIVTVVVSILWVVYNLLIIGGAMAVAAEARQVRQTHRVQVKLPAAVRLESGHSYPGMLQDYSDGGAGIQLDTSLSLAVGGSISLMMQRGTREFLFPGYICRSHKNFIGISFTGLNAQQKIDFVQCTFARADAWLNWGENFTADRPLHSLLDIVKLGGTGYYRLYEYLPAWIRRIAGPPLRMLRWLASFLPRMPVVAPTPNSRSVSAP